MRGLREVRSLFLRDIRANRWFKNDVLIYYVVFKFLVENIEMPPGISTTDDISNETSSHTILLNHTQDLLE